MAFAKTGQAERRRDVAGLLRQGMTEREIARRLGVHHVTVCHDVGALKAEWRAAASADRDIWIQAELGKLQELEAVCWGVVYSDARGRLGAVDRIVAILARRAALLGLDAATRLDVRHDITTRAVQLAREYDLPLDEVLAEIHAILQGER